MLRGPRFVIAGLVVLGACGGKVERGDDTSDQPSTPVIPPPNWGGSAGGPSRAPPPDPEPVSPAQCPAQPPEGWEHCAVAPDTPCTYVWAGGWQRCHCPGATTATRIWECEMCAGCNCPAELPDTGDSCEAYPGATPCPSLGIHGYCSCSPALTWECSLEPGGVGGAGGWSGGG